MRQIATVLLALMLALGAGTATIGCSSHTTTTTRTIDQSGDGGTVRSETTTTESTDGSGPHFGILSGTVKAVGFVLALPFKLVGGLISIIF
ncbi:MAG: hypothetical protein HYY35_10735 [Deltaproteobacteria bacterium]|nr:hypothetical protein [Deltaproteobacteria bacterium]